jgi:SAM-dependent methyltransferase
VSRRGERRARRAEQAARVAAGRPRYQADIAAGLGRFFQPPRVDCPWCGGTELCTRLRTVDLFQHKPGRFSLDECRRCGHIFQNPRLSSAGLEFYYRDFYDGLGERSMERLFAGQGKSYTTRAELLRPYADPRSWLDVGTGHGHFCRAARDSWPRTRFEGLDMSAGVRNAAERGWIDQGHRAEFVELGPDLGEGYDVVSMFHYLEHTTDPRAELETAFTVLRGGGHLLIEVPDPECRWARVLRRYWVGWLQPQHLQLMPARNLRRRLTELGFTVEASGPVDAHHAFDMLVAGWLGINRVAPPEDMPWCPVPPSRLARLTRATLFILGVPALLAAWMIDRFGPCDGAGWSPAYWVIARKG